jgi:recombination protein RecT
MVKTNETQNQTPAKKVSIGNFLNFPNTSKFLEDALREKKSEFVSNLLALTDSDENLQKCDPKKLMMCAMNATALGLPLNKNLGYAYVIAYYNTKKKEHEPQFQIGAKGFKQLAMKSSQYQTINAVEIREKELTRNKFTGEFKFNQENPEGNIEGYLAYFRLLNGYEKSLYMTVEQLESHALKYSQAYKSDIKNKTKYSKWSTEEKDSMCLKTVYKLLLSREGILSTEMVNALSFDNRNIEDAEVIEQKEKETKKVKI